MFIIDLGYTQPLNAIDEHMAEHVRYLDKHYAAGSFIMSGRKVPRTGGLILAKGATKKAIEKIMKQDPFYKHGLAEFTITEFNASRKVPNIDELMED